MSEAGWAGVVGSPVGHSLSPVLHRGAYEALDLPWRYDAFEVPDGELPGFVETFPPAWRGLSVTMPHKKAALALADVREPLAETVGAANTLLPQGTGPGRLIVAANTDVYGIVASIREVRGSQAATPRTGVVLGAGGTAAAGLAALAELGITDPIVCVRSSARAADLLQAAHRMGIEVTLRRFDHGARFIADADIVLQTAPAGAADEIAQELPALARPGALRPDQVLLEAIYAPWPTALAAAWQRCGGGVAAGWLLLLHQAAEQVRLMTGRPAPLQAMRAAVLAALH